MFELSDFDKWFADRDGEAAEDWEPVDMAELLMEFFDDESVEPE